MGGAAVELVPLALGIAASPFPVIPVVLLLLTPRPAATSRAFLAGWVLGIAVGVVAATLLSDLVTPGSTPPAWASWLRVLLGLVLLVAAVRQWRSRAATAEPPGWLRQVESATPGSAFRLALVLSLANPKVLLLAVAAGLTIGTAALGGQGVVLVVAFTATASLSVAVPVLLHATLGERVLGPLGRVRDVLLRHAAAITAGVMLVLGVLVLTTGLAELR